MIQAALTAGSAEFWALVLLAVLVGGYLWYLERKTHFSKADRLQQTYQTLTEEQILALPEEDVLPAVIANIMAKQDKKQPDPYFDLPFLSPQRAAVYRAWLVCRETEEGGFPSLLRTKKRLLTEAAVEDLWEIGAKESSAALRAALEMAAQAGAEKEAETVFAAAQTKEKPLELCVAYIRDNPAAFVD